MTPWEAQTKQIEDLKALHKEGLKFNLLFNANYYGNKAQARSFFSEIGEMVDCVAGKFSLSSMTTTSPLIAKFIKQNFHGIDVRASVNMGIGSILGMKLVARVYRKEKIRREYGELVRTQPRGHDLPLRFGKRKNRKKNRKWKTYIRERRKCVREIGGKLCLPAK